MTRYARSSTSGASPRHARAALLTLALLAAMALSASPAQALETRLPTGASLGPDGLGGSAGFQSLQAVAVDHSNGDLYVLDTAEGGSLYRFDASGAPLDFASPGANFIAGVGGSQTSGANSENEIAIAPPGAPGGTAGDIYVANNSVVRIYSPAGDLLGEISGDEEVGHEACGVATDPAGHVFVGFYPDTVREYTPTADPATDADKSGQSVATLPSICNVAADGLGNVYASSFSGSATAKLEGLADPSPTLIEPGGASPAIDPASDELYLDRGSRVAFYSPAGAPAGQFGAANLSESRGVAIDPAAERAYVSNGSSGKVDLYGPIVILPDVVTEAADAVTKDSATLHGTISAAGGPPAECEFQYVTEAAFQANKAKGEGHDGFAGATGVDCAPDGPFSGSATEAVSAAITGLHPGSDYRFRILGANADGSSPGQALGFLTLGPTVRSTTATDVTTDSATLTGFVAPHGKPFSYHFDYGPDESYGSSIPVPDAVGDELPVGTGNAEGSTPTIEAVVMSQGAFAVGQDIVGAAIKPGTTITAIEGSTLTLSAFPTQGGPVSITSTTVFVSEPLTGLAPGSAYHARLVATNADATYPGPDTGFSTYPVDTGLPDGRAYEMVTPAKKIGEPLPPEPFGSLAGSCPVLCLPGSNDNLMPMQATADGESLVFEGQPFSEGLSPAANQYLAKRSSAGWSSPSITPPLASPARDTYSGFKAFSDDLTRGVLYQATPTLSDEAPAGEEGKAFNNLYLWEAGNPNLRPLVTVTPPNRVAGTPDLPGTFRLSFASANSAFTHLVFEANDALTEAEPTIAPAAPEAGEARCGGFAESKCNLYEWVGGQLALVNVLPGNDAAASGAVIGSGRRLALPNPDNQAENTDHAISADGKRIFWSDETGQVYVRVEGKETIEIKDSGQFLTASVDGSKVLLSDGCLYSLEAESCEANLGASGPAFLGVMGASEDLSRIYFLSKEALAAAPEAGTCDVPFIEPGLKEEAEGKVPAGLGCNLYVYDGGDVSFLATLFEKDNNFGQNSNFGSWKAAKSNRTAQVTPDGRYLAFMSRARLAGYDNRIAGGGTCRGSTLGIQACLEVYAYDLETGELECPSCNPSGQRPVGRSTLSLIYPELGAFSQPENLPADGEGRLFFQSEDVLTTADTNGHVVDVYEWTPDGVGDCAREAGCIALISSGHSPNDSFFIDSTPSGDDVFFVTREQLPGTGQGRPARRLRRPGGGRHRRSGYPALRGRSLQGLLHERSARREPRQLDLQRTAQQEAPQAQEAQKTPQAQEAQAQKTPQTQSQAAPQAIGPAHEDRRLQVNARKHLTAIIGLALLTVALLAPAGAQAAFGIQPGSFSATATAADGSPVFQAGSHPYDYTVKFAMNQDSGGFPEGQLRSLVVDLPPGLVGDPLAVPQCSSANFEGQASACPGDTQIGVFRALAQGGAINVTQPIFNMAPVFGSPARFGFSVTGFNSFQEASLRSDGDYGIGVVDLTVPNIELQTATETIWGVPGDPSHDSERECIVEGHAVLNCATTVPPAPFLTLPTSCGGPLETTLTVNSIEEPDVFHSETYVSEDDEGTPTGIDGCNALQFEPSISSQPTTNLADSPTGLDFTLHQPQAGHAPQGGEPAEVCNRGKWTGSPGDFDFQWLRNGAAIPGATSSEYTPTGADAGTVLQCEVTATDPAAAGPGHAVSAPKTIPPAPATAPPVPLFGFLGAYLELRPGPEVAACESYWEAGEPTITRRWFKNGVLIPGESGETIPYHPADGPQTFQCEAVGTNAGGAVVAFSENASSDPPPSPAIPNAGIEDWPKVSPAPLKFPSSTAHLKEAVVTLPQGVSLNPSAGNGLAACSNQEIGYQPSGGQIHFSKSPQSCPNASKVGTLEAASPLVDHPLQGAVYVAKPYDNPFGTLLAIYLAVEDEQTGIVAKLGGKVEPNPSTGQLKATFTENPQLPIEDIDLHFFDGPRAALKTPIACGRYTTTSTLTPWSTPGGAAVSPSDSFETSVAAGGSGPCPKAEAEAPNKPSFSAGTIAPQAGAYSPFVLKLSREDGSQQLTGLDATLPKGLTGKLAGIPYCSEAQIAVAKDREKPNLGGVEQASPSCPAASEVGAVTVGAGAGTTPLFVGGHAYLAGPYKGAPLSLVIITPAVAGPFDLGAVVVRTALYVNPQTTQIHAVSDPLPTILEGIPLDLRSIAVKLGKPGFTLNPTSCDPTAITGSAMALTGQSAGLTSPFQVGGCSSLKFKPKLKISLKGGTKRNRYPALKAVLTYPKGGAYANIASAQVTLPHSAFLEQSHIGSVCTRPQLASQTCPKASIYGRARAVSPLLDKPLSGPVYLGVGFGHDLPDLVADLNGQIRVLLNGKIDTGKEDGIRNTFLTVPDAPVSKFTLEMFGGKKGLIVNSENLCGPRAKTKALAHLTGQNGASLDLHPRVGNSCKAKKRSAHDGRSAR